MNANKGAGLQVGLTLVELLVFMVISLLIFLAASSFFLSSSRTSATQDAASLLNDNARYLTEIITKNIQQAGYQNYTADSAGAKVRREVATLDGEPDIRGYNNSAAGSSLDNGSHNRTTNRVNNSDTLIVRFQGSSISTTTGTGTAAVTVTAADGTMIDCLGRSQPAPDAATDRAYSVFEVQTSSTGEPELRCKYKNVATNLFTTEPIVRGVETFQLMYGVDTNGDSFVDAWRNAEQVDAANQWFKIRSVRVGMVLRSPNRSTVASTAQTYLPLGTNFAQAVGTDPGSSFTVGADDGRLRRVVTFTVNLRNAL